MSGLFHSYDTSPEGNDEARREAALAHVREILLMHGATEEEIDRAVADHVITAPKPDIGKVHADFVMALAARKPPPIPREPDPEDFSARAICCEALIERMAAHLTALVEDAADNDCGGFIRDAGLADTIDAHLGDLKSDITGMLERIAERLRDDRYDGCRRGPFYRRRRV